jgi:hypothetical protein
VHFLQELYKIFKEEVVLAALLIHNVLKLRDLTFGYVVVEESQNLGKLLG